MSEPQHYAKDGNICACGKLWWTCFQERNPAAQPQEVDKSAVNRKPEVSEPKSLTDRLWEELKDVPVCLCFVCSHQPAYGPCASCRCGNPRGVGSAVNRKGLTEEEALDYALDSPNSDPARELAARGFKRINCCESAREAAALRERLDSMAGALSGVWALIEDGTLVRNVAADTEPGWSLKALRMVGALKDAQEALVAYRAGGGET